MNTPEFIAWFEGFTARIKGKPSRRDWDEIVSHVGALEASSPLKAWFDGLRVKVRDAPNDKIWRDIKTHVAAAGEAAAGKKRSLQNLFESFEGKSETMRDAPSDKARAEKPRK